MNGEWGDSGLIQAAESPAEDTRLSVSTTIVPSLTLGNTTEMSPSYLSSVVIYQQKNTSFVMMNTDPDTQTNDYLEGSVSPNLFDLFQSQGARVPATSSTGLSFSCIYNSQYKSVDVETRRQLDPSQLYAECYISGAASSPFVDTIWTYNQSNLGSGYYRVVDPGSNTLQSRSS